MTLGTFLTLVWCLLWVAFVVACVWFAYREEEA
jgi:hypothetical protein